MKYRQAKVNPSQLKINVNKYETKAPQLTDIIAPAASKLHQIREFADLDEQVKSVTTKSGKIVRVGSNMVSAHSSSLCGNEAVASVMKDHIETNQSMQSQ